MTCLEDVAGHGETHVAGADEADVHDGPLAQDFVD
jgi:hypothetical protein